MKYLLTIFIILCTTYIVSVQAKEYYVSSQGNDANPGTKESPWKTISKVNKHAFQPGDIILFERNSKFSGGLFIDDSGRSGNSIIYTAYGTGKSPHLVNNNHDIFNGNVIQISGSHIIIDGFYFKDGLPTNKEKKKRQKRTF